MTTLRWFSGVPVRVGRICVFLRRRLNADRSSAFLRYRDSEVSAAGLADALISLVRMECLIHTQTAIAHCCE